MRFLFFLGGLRKIGEIDGMFLVGRLDSEMRRCAEGSRVPPRADQSADPHDVLI